jgi:hypothetical protein
MIGIYKIQSKKFPERFYIGKTTDYRNRVYIHLLNLKSSTHHCNKLMLHCNEYGIEDLKFTLIRRCRLGELNKWEAYFIETLKPYFNGLSTRRLIKFQDK